MTRYFALSSFLHATLAGLAVVLMGVSVKQPTATYTIDFIGSGKVIAMQGTKAAEVQKSVAAAEPAPAAKPETQKPSQKAYDSKTEIAAKKQTKKKDKPAPLAAPSILDEEKPSSQAQDPAAGASSGNGEGEFEGGNIQTDFATFPYPWYITQVRNNLWSEWEKRRPTGVLLRTLLTFSIARDGKIKNLRVTESSQDDSFDFAAKSAIINAGPFQPLPMLYEKDELTVTVEFKQER